MVQAIHTSIKGRARYYVRELYRSVSLQKYLERSLSQYTEIIGVTASSLTGNLLVKFKPDKSDAEIAVLIEKSIANYQQQKPESRQKALEAEEQPTENWHLLDSNSVLEKFSSSQDSGLDSDTVSQNLERYGRNALVKSKSRSDWSIFADQFQSLPVALLGVASGISLISGGFADAVAITGVILTNSVIGYITESQSEKIINSLQSDEIPSALVIRNGEQQKIEIEAIVVGDILIIENSSYIAADARLIETDNLSIDESALTGESIAVSKNTETLTGENIPLGERTNMVYKGTFVTAGKGKAVVVATGKFTEMGKIQGMVSQAESSQTPLQKQLDEVGSQLVLLCSGVCGFTFALGVLRGYGFLPMLKTAISLAVASVPEGLPTIATTTLALGMHDMRKRHILIRGLNAVEALGSVQTICLDKTGTITQNQMIVAEVHIDIGIITLSDNGFIKDNNNNNIEFNPSESEALSKLLQVVVLCSESEVIPGEDGKYEVKGSATENALIYMAIAAGMDIPAFKAKHPLIKTYPRTENRNIMTTVHKTEGEQILIAVKGSPEEVIKICTRVSKNGEVVSLTQEDKQALELENERMAGKALRVLGVAYAYVDNGNENPEHDLIWLGLTGMADPIRQGVAQLMEQFHQAGIDTVMITGDQSPTAYAIAKKLNLNRNHKLEILDSSDLAEVGSEKLQALCQQVDVFARVSPADKLQIVQALQGKGKIVAMTGDGINDTPALKAADVGVAMGSGKADVVREVADVVIEDDRLETIINAVSRGRTIYSNIRKSVHFLLSTNLSEIIVTTAATALGLGEPLNTMQLLWLNLVSDIFPGLALAMEAPEPEVLNRPPRNPDQPIIKRSDFERIAVESGVISTSALTAYSYGLLKYGQKPQASTILFMSLTLAQVLHTVSCRSETHSIFDRERLPDNPYVDGAVVGSAALQLLPLFIPGLGNLLQLAPLDPLDWLVIASSAGLPLIINESTKTSSSSL
ncbi:cation-transporting P-type ATPase [Plectonema cf. radiosum LEGE 06105]|uniref:Cation-transporting P-type ATPase n=1 Tax=Plectonema cf. radiosum LEGE 06105 TaxID=945769 RepID=A0A8J7F347_9CYAN|nr:HAD-IC family P-type ATPase [Plectonema radiosum]MBE9212270.1 cation-transporting P-type ATPase [Plectonema cf. radiosum LEGE 06105]